MVVVAILIGVFKDRIRKSPAVGEVEARISDNRAHQLSEIEKRIPGGLTVGERIPIAHGILDASERFKVEPDIIMTVIAIESEFDPAAVSPAGARGLMQVLPSTANFINARLPEPIAVPTRGLHESYFNIMIGTAYLAYLRGLYENRFSGRDLWVAVALAYNRGPQGASLVADPKLDSYVRKFENQKKGGK
jgi:soluble lytic murein transglycosylase-like protein